MESGVRPDRRNAYSRQIASLALLVRPQRSVERLHDFRDRLRNGDATPLAETNARPLGHRGDERDLRGVYRCFGAVGTDEHYKHVYVSPPVFDSLANRRPYVHVREPHRRGYKLSPMSQDWTNAGAGGERVGFELRR